MRQLTAKQINNKYRGKYIEVSKQYDYNNDRWLYSVIKTHSTIHENTTRGEDLETDMEYRR